MSNDYFEQSKKAWVCASSFPANKEEVYPEHKMVQEFDLIHDKDVYEYGCGNGSDARSYLKRGNRVTATDIVPENIATATKYTLEAGFTEDQFKFILIDKSYPLPFESESFDVISSHGVLHHVKEADNVIKDLYRIARPGASLYFMVYTDILWDHHFPVMENLMKTRGIDKYEAFCWMTDGEGTPYARCYTATEACEFAENAGFTVVDFNYWLNDWFITVKAVK